MTLNGEMAIFALFFTEFGNFKGVLRKSGWQKTKNNYGQFTITMSSSKRPERDRVTPAV